MTAQICIETNRLILKPASIEDVERVAQSWNLEGPPLTHAEAEALLLRMGDNHARNAPGKIYHLCLAIVHKETGEFMGWCGLDHRQPDWPNPVLFYLIHGEQWGKGYATEAARALIDFAFRELAIPVVDASCFADNFASRRVLEKIGMRSAGRNAEGGLAFTIRRDASGAA